MSLNPQTRSELTAMIATMLMVAPAEVTDSTSLASLNTSLGAAKVRLGLMRLGLAVPANAKPATFGGLIATLSGEVAAPVARAAQAGATSATSGAVIGGTLQVGLDIEDVRSLPAAADYWEHDFYRSTFAKSEIAYAVLQPEPRIHFAGFWCAKEALRKCDSAFAGVSPDQTAVAHDGAGRPYLSLLTGTAPERLPHVLSISHTTDVATAVVVTGYAAPEVVVAAIEPLIAEQLPAEPRRSRGLAKLFGL